MKRKTTLMICAFCLVQLANLFYSSVHASESDTRPIVYLTFDDGPSADDTTEEVLALLDRYGAKATFFVTGQRTRSNGSKIPHILYAGHAIGNHTNKHALLVNHSSEEVYSELEKANQAVLDAGGPPLTCFRPPFGSTNKRVNSIAADLGLVPVRWSLDTRDWDTMVQQSTIYDTLDRSEDGSIVLMHDGPAKRNKTLTALSDWLAVSAHLFQFKALPSCQPYGANTLLLADIDDHEPDRLPEPETMESLLMKLRSYRFSLLSETTEIRADVWPELNVTAKLELQVAIKP